MRRGEPPAAAEGLERQERADGGQGGSRARRGESRRKRQREDTRASCPHSRVRASSSYRQPRRPPATRGRGIGGPHTSLLLVPSGARACDRSEPAAAPPSPALTAPRGAAAAAASSVPASPAPWKSPPRTWAPGSAGGKTRDSETSRHARLKQPSQTLVWIKRNTIYFWQKKRKGRPAGFCKEKKGDVTRGYVFFPTPPTSCSTL